MKAWRLIWKLLRHPLCRVVVDVHDENGELTAYDIKFMDYGWLPSGVVSIVTEYPPVME